MGERSRESTRRGEQDALRETLREVRLAAGLTAKELSLRMRAHHSFVSRIERGQRTIDVIEFLDIAEAAGRNPEEVFVAFLDRVRRQ